MAQKTKTRFPTDAVAWNASVRLRFLKSFEGMLDKVPLDVRRTVYEDCGESLEAYLLATVPAGQPHAAPPEAPFDPVI